MPKKGIPKHTQCMQIVPTCKQKGRANKKKKPSSPYDELNQFTESIFMDMPSMYT